MFVYDHEGPYFTGTLLKLSAHRDVSPDFNVFQTLINGENVTTLRGDKLLHHDGDVSVRGNLLLGENSEGSETVTAKVWV